MRVVSDQGRELDLEATCVMESSQGAEWSFVRAGTHFHDGLVESRARALKHALEHKLQESIIGSNLALNDAELCKLLSRAADAVNGHLLGL